MAKRKTTKADDQGLPANLRTRINAMRAPFLAFARAFGPIFQRREAIAPKFMALYWDWKKAREKVGASRNDMAFVAFVRVMDATVPLDVKGYKAHPVYASADYIRRKFAQRSDNASTANKPSALAQTARWIATITQAVDPEIVWRAVTQEFQLSARQVSALQKEVARTKPILKLSHVRPVKATVEHMAPTAMRTARQQVGAPGQIERAA